MSKFSNFFALKNLFFFFLQLVTILQSNLNMVLYVDMCVYVFVLHHGCVMVSPLHFCALHCSQQKYVTEHIFYNLPFSSMGDFWGWDVCALGEHSLMWMCHSVITIKSSSVLVACIVVKITLKITFCPLHFPLNWLSRTSRT